MELKIGTDQQRVADFMTRFGQTVRHKPSLPTASEQSLRVQLIAEELRELQEAFDKEDIVQVADALGDLLYVVLGTAVSCGITLAPIFTEIHRSNMTKLWDEEPRVRRNAAGKVLKPPTYSPADLVHILERQSL